MNCSYLFSSRKIIQIRTVEDSTRAGQKLHCKIIVSSRREVNASCSCVLFYLLQLCEMALSRNFSVYTNLVISVEIQIFFSVYTNLVISVEIQIFSLFPLSTAEPPTHKKPKNNPTNKTKTLPITLQALSDGVLTLCDVQLCGLKTRNMCTGEYTAKYCCHGRERWETTTLPTRRSSCTHVCLPPFHSAPHLSYLICT